jgi:hypothetical protein
MSRWAAASGVVFFLLWAPMGLVVLQAPDLGSSAEIRGFYASHGGLVEVVALLVGVGFLFLLYFLGALLDELRRAEPSGPLTWLALASSLVFVTSLNIAVGLVATARLLSGTISPDALRGVHAAAFVIAAPAAAAGTGFFAAIAALTFRAPAIPNWLAWAAVIGAVANLGALAGVISVTGPLNAGNGIVGGPLVPVSAWLAWILLASLHWLRSPRDAPGGGRRRARSRGCAHFQCPGRG